MLADYTTAEIEAASRETDSTMLELIREFEAVNSNPDFTNHEEVKTHIYDWIVYGMETMTDYMNEQRALNMECTLCGGSGGIPEAPCYRCSGTGKRRG